MHNTYRLDPIKTVNSDLLQLDINKAFDKNQQIQLPYFLHSFYFTLMISQIQY